MVLFTIFIIHRKNLKNLKNYPKNSKKCLTGSYEAVKQIRFFPVAKNPLALHRTSIGSLHRWCQKKSGQLYVNNNNHFLHKKYNEVFKVAFFMKTVNRLCLQILTIRTRFTMHTIYAVP